MNDNLVTQYGKLDFKSLVFWTALLAVGSPVVAQEIEIIGNDGRQVEIEPRVSSEIVPPARILAPEQATGKGKSRGKGLTVMGPDGQPMFLPTENARSVQIQRSVSTQIINGQRTVVNNGTAIVVGADGQRREYELAETDNVDGLATMQLDQQPAAKKSWMVGVVCQPAPAMIRSQLALDGDTGLLVQQVQPSSPADVGGLKKFDVLLYANDQQLSSVKDLTAVVQEVGLDGGVITLTVVRGGEEIPIEVQPIERDFTAMPMRRIPMDMFEMNDMGPGILFGQGNGNDGGMLRMREMIQQQMQQMREEFRNMDTLIQEGLPMQLEMPQFDQ